MPCFLRFTLICCVATAAISAARSQAAANAGPPHALIGLRYAATRASSPPGSCGCFLLQGASMDAALPFRAGVSGVVELSGNHANIVPGTSRQLSTISLLAGPRYRLRLGPRQALFAQGLFGAVRGFDADFRRGTNETDTATGFAYALGGAYEFRLTRTVNLRPIQIELIQTNLPNGADNRQRNVRFGAGVSFRVPLGIARR